jgi:hypothetical protein
MKKYWIYLKYILKHKWYVWQECYKHGLYWQGLVHDMSKFRPDEFIPYARFFYDDEGRPKAKRDKTGYYKPTNSGDIKFDLAWMRHCKRNKHHWQYWTVPQDYEGLMIFDMPEKYMVEAICDWVGASRAQGLDSSNVLKWYKANRVKMQLSNRTAKGIARLLEIFNLKG